MYACVIQRGADATAFMQLIVAGPPFDEKPSAGFIAVVVLLVLSIIAILVLLYCLTKTRKHGRNFYRHSKKNVDIENEEFSSDSESQYSTDEDNDSEIVKVEH